MRHLKPGDLLVAALALAAAGVVFLSGLSQGSGRLVAVVTQDGRELKRIVLTGLTDRVRFAVDGAYQNIIVAQDGKVWVESASCPNQTCVHSGKLSRAGQSAVCLENHMILSVQAEGGGEVDVVIR